VADNGGLSWLVVEKNHSQYGHVSNNGKKGRDCRIAYAEFLCLKSNLDSTVIADGYPSRDGCL